MIRIAAILALLASPVCAESTARWSQKTYATIQATQEPGAVAEIIFHNAKVNYLTDNSTVEISLGGLTVALTFTWEVGMDGSDQIVAVVPEGYIAVPDTLLVPEDDHAVMLIYENTALGM